MKLPQIKSTSPSGPTTSSRLVAARVPFAPSPISSFTSTAGSSTISGTSCESQRATVEPVTGPRSIAAVRVLRISVTDRCNFRCVYCMPAEGIDWLPSERILGFDEIADVVRTAIDLHGIRQFKLTGGEPTLRPGIVELVRTLAAIDGVDDLSMTTNGLLLEKLASPFRDAGLKRVTVSLDSLDVQKFRKITRTGDLSVVLKGIDAAERVGLPLKINCVTMRGTNEDELVDFARLTLTRSVTVRFIEYMPLGDAALLRAPSLSYDAGDRQGKNPSPTDTTPIAHRPPRIALPIGKTERELRVADSEIGPAGGCGAQDRGRDALVSEIEVRSAIETELGPLVAVRRDTEPGAGPATVWKLDRPDATGRIGFISAMSAPFCSTCNRLRLTADGVLRSCLFEGGEVDLLPILRNGDDTDTRRAKLADAMVQCVRLKPDVHTNRGLTPMSRIGG